MPKDGPANRNDSLARNNTRGARNDLTTARRLLANRLSEAGLATDRFIKLQDGRKAPVDHTQYEPDTLGSQYGVYAGRDLVIVDYDPYEVEKSPGWLNNLPPTFTVESAHGGRHYYFSVGDGVENTEFKGGSVRAQNQYVVGPGSQLDGCDKEWCNDCGHPDGGLYEIVHDAPIASITATSLPSKGQTTEQELSGDVVRNSATFAKFDEINAPCDAARRIEVLKNSKIGEKFTALLEGRYADAGFEGDRSAAETSLVTYLRFLFGDDTEIVAQVMDAICNQKPRTDTGQPRKWLQSKHHRETALSQEYAPDNLYEEPVPATGERPKVSHITYENVMVATADLGPATAEEIAEHKANDRKKRQTENALKELIEDGIVKREKDTDRPYNLYVYWVIGTEAQPSV